MTENRRIALNTVASYGRTLFAALCGIFSARWVLEALGQVDFGLYGVIGSMVIFITFLNTQFSCAIARYYAYAIGEARTAADKTKGLDECRAWFSVAFVIHAILPLVLISVGYPLGCTAIKHGWVAIPADKIHDCIWLWRFVCVSCFVSMINVPFQAMYTAKQYIAELTVYSFVQTALRTAFVYYMATHPGHWLVAYGAGVMFILISPALIICVRACLVFPECRLRVKAMREFWRIGKLGGFAFWHGIGGLGYIASHQGMSILVNNSFGARVTGSFSVSQHVSGEAAALTSALQGAFTPAITTAYGSGDLDRMRNLSFMACKFGTLLTLMFAIPMALEIDGLLTLWLKNPPPHASGFCLATLAFIVIEKLSAGHLTAINASGRVARFQTYRGILRMSVIPIALIAVFFGWGAVAAASALPISVSLVVLCDVILARTRAGMSVRRWAKEVLLPLVIVAIICSAVGCLPRCVLAQGFARLVVTTVVVLAVLVPLVWFVILSSSERNFFKATIGRKLGFCK